MTDTPSGGPRTPLLHIPRPDRRATTSSTKRALARNPTWYLQQVLPPALLTYFARAWWVLTFHVSPTFLVRRYGVWAARAYAVLPTLTIGSITLVYLRLYFLPKDQCVPPRDPPLELLNGKDLFECLPPSAIPVPDAQDGAGQGEPRPEPQRLVERCHRGSCRGRWKPARARHCSECGRCRMGFDHHCPLFANCLTAPYLSCFLALLLWTPPTAALLSLPLYGPLASRAAQAYDLRRTSAGVKGWYDWPLSWVVAGGPVGRWVGGVVLGWRELDKDAAQRVEGLEMGTGVVVALGAVLAALCVGLATTSWSLLSRGSLTIDREHQRSYARALLASSALRDRGQPVPPQLQAELDRWGGQKWFFVPLPRDLDLGPGEIVRTELGEQVYDLGPQRNRQLVLGNSWAWLLPWRAIREGLDTKTLYNWPIELATAKRLAARAVAQAKARLEQAEEQIAGTHADGT